MTGVNERRDLLGRVLPWQESLREEIKQLKKRREERRHEGNKILAKPLRKR